MLQKIGEKAVEHGIVQCVLMQRLNRLKYEKTAYIQVVDRDLALEKLKVI